MVALPRGSRSSSTRWPAVARPAARFDRWWFADATLLVGNAEKCGPWAPGPFHDDEVAFRVEAGTCSGRLASRAVLRDAGDLVGRMEPFHGQDAGAGAGQVGGEVHEVGQVGEGARDDPLPGASGA